MIQKRPGQAARSRKGRKKSAGSASGATSAAARGASVAASSDGGEALEAEVEVEAREDVEQVELADEPEAELPPEDSDPLDEVAEEPAEATEGEGDAEHETEQSSKPKKPKKPAREPLDIAQLALRVEALLFASGQVLGLRKLSKALQATGDEVREALDRLTETWSERETAMELVEVSGGWRLMTRAAYHEDVAQLTAKTRIEKLSPAALETLAVVAYRQPIGRAEIEAVRGVQCGPLLRVLLDRDLIRISGRSSEPGHPLLYGTTKRFLDHFGLASLKNLPDVKDLLNVS